MDDVNARQTLAANIRRELLARNLSQSALARACGWHPSRVGEILAAEHNPRLDTIEVIAKVLGVATPSLLMPVPEEAVLAS